MKTSYKAFTTIKEELHMKKIVLIILITLIATIGGFLFGFDSGVINGTVTGLEKSFDSNSIGTGFNVASMLLGCAIGAFIAGRLADFLGRRSILLIAAVFFTISAAGSGIAETSIQFIIFRVIGGLAVGAASVLAPAYISEIAPAKFRGMLSSIQQVAIISGLFFAFLSNYLIAGKAGGSTNEFALGYEAWRWMFWIELIPAILFFIGLLFIPESPRYLVASGKKNKALNVLKKISKEDSLAKYNEIKNSLSPDNHRPRFRDIFSKYGFKPIIWAGLGLAVFQQLVGINVVFYYGSVLWQAAGFTEANALLINVVTGAVSIGACIIAISVIDKIGRKPMLLVGSVGMAITLGVMAFVFGNASLNEAGKLILSDKSGIVSLVAANLYVFFFNFSWGPVMWVMLGEMFPNQIRGSALAVTGFAQWVANFTITITFPIMLTTIGLGAAYLFYSVSAFVSIFFVIKVLQETKGIELENMK